MINFTRWKIHLLSSLRVKYTTLSKKLDNVLKGSNIPNLLNVDTIDSKTIAKRMDKC